MTFVHATPGAGSPRAYASNRRAMKVTLRATYPFFFAATVARRINPFAAKPVLRASIFAETRARAAAIVPFFFMG